MTVSMGDLVLYELTGTDLERIEAQRPDWPAPWRSLNLPRAGEVRPALVVQMWKTTDAVNLHVFLDGLAGYWALGVLPATATESAGRWWHLQAAPRDLVGYAYQRVTELLSQAGDQALFNRAGSRGLIEVAQAWATFAEDLHVQTSGDVGAGLARSALAVPAPRVPPV